MKYNGFGSIAKLYSNFYLNYFKTLFQTNIRLAYWTPQKAILYSTRLFQGEKFLLQNKLLYPYDHSPKSNEEANKPLSLSISLENSLFEADTFLDYLLEGEPKHIKDKHSEQVLTNIVEKADILGLTIQVEDESKLDLPVAIYARLIFAKVVGNIIKLDLKVSDETFDKTLRLYLNKLRFSDSNSISMVIYALAFRGNRDPNVWKLLFERLGQVSFESEFTKVNNCSPHLFKYRELDSIEKDYQSGDLALHLASVGLQKAVENKISGASEALSQLESRIKLISNQEVLN